VLLTLAMLAGLPPLADASEIRYRFRGTVGGILASEEYAYEDGTIWHRHLEAAGADFRTGEPIEATLIARSIPPTSVSRDRYGAIAHYRFGEGQATFEVSVGGRTFGRSERGDDLILTVQDMSWEDVFTGHQQFGAVAPSVAWSAATFNLEGIGGELFEGTGLPDRLPIWQTLDPSSSDRSLGLRIGFDDLSWIELTTSITDIEVTVIDDDPTPDGPAGPGNGIPSTPVPEPGMMTIFSGIALVGLAWRHVRRRSVC
jgi:hypothetical protein